MSFVRNILVSMLVLSLLWNLSSIVSAQILNSKPTEANSGDLSLSDYEQELKNDQDVNQTSWLAIPLPKITMPRMAFPDISPVTAPAKSGWQKVTTGTRRAWEGTKEIFTSGSENSTSPSPQNREPSFWSRMFSTTPKEPDVPQTVGEWMSQPRLDP